MSAELMTPAQVARRLAVTEQTVYDWLRKGRLRGVKLGRLWRVSNDDLDAFLSPERNEFAEPLTESEAAESDAAWQAYVDGQDPGESLADVRRALLSARAWVAGHPPPRGTTLLGQASAGRAGPALGGAVPS